MPTRPPDDSSSGVFAPRFVPGDVVDGRYRVVRFLASGGMGDVYEVTDGTTGMSLALKALQPDLASQDHQRQRFLREIQLASKVTHPNVCRIFASGIHERPEGPSQPYLTMELLAGDTLDRRLADRRRLDPHEVLPIARQLARALDAAHAAGVVHRDFKTGNIMLVAADDGSHDGSGEGRERVVVTDFGLARAVGVGSDRHFVTLAEDSGLVGTAAFMAPEQVVGDEQTAATDVYAFGVVLFQMLTGKMPFAAEGLVPAAVARLQQRPRAARDLRPDLPRPWSAVLERCLERRPADRFASAGDVVEALEGRTKTRVPSRVRRRRALSGAGLGLAVAVVLATLTVRQVRQTERDAAPPQVSDPVQLTIDEGLEIDPAYSPDGSFLVYSADRGGHFELYRRCLDDAGSAEVRLATSGLHAVQPAVSPDGRRLVYVSREPRGIWLLSLDDPSKPQRTPQLEPQRLTDFGSRPDWTPDGRHVVFQEDSRTDVSERSLPALPPSSLWRISVGESGAASEPEPLTRAGEPPGGHGEPRVSPDGRFVAFSSGDRRRTAIWRLALQTEDGDVEPEFRRPQVLADRSRVNLHPVWSPDGAYLYWLGIAEGLDRQAAAYAIWRVALDADGQTAGEPQQITRLGVATIRQFDLLPSAIAGEVGATQVLVYGALNTYSHLWALPLDGGLPAGEPTRWTRGRLRHSRPAFSPDGTQIAYDRWQVGTNLDIWVQPVPADDPEDDPEDDKSGDAPVAETEPRQVTFAGEWDSQATWLPGGDRFAFFSEREGRRGIWVVDVTTGDNSLLADIGPDADWARLSPDGTRIAYHSRQDGPTLDVWVYDIVSELHSRLTLDPEMAAFPIWSPDGERLGLEVRRDGSTQVAVMDATGGEVRVLTREEGESWPYSWSPDGTKIAFAALRDGFWHLRWVSVEDGNQQQLTDQRRLNAYVRYPAWSPDGRRLVYELSETVGDLWRVELSPAAP